jgi:hypothetical protein
LTWDTYIGNYIDPLSLNRYTYAHNNPIKYIDPSGFVVTEWDLKNCSAAQIAQIKAATDAWNVAKAAGNQTGMDTSHAAANAAREGNLSTGQYVSLEGYVRESNGTAATGGNKNVYLSTGDKSKLSIDATNKMATEDPKMLMDLQLEFLIDSCQTSTPSDKREWWPTNGYHTPFNNMTFNKYIKSDKDPRDLALVFFLHYERSGASLQQLKDTRVTYANNWDKYFKK